VADDRLSLRRHEQPYNGDDLRALEETLDGWRRIQSRPCGVYICSLTENPNQLSQWRGYCPNGGVSIGFDSNELHLSMVPRGVITAKVCYRREDQERIVDGILDYLLFDEVPEAYQDASRAESLQEEFHCLLSMGAPLFKHPGFMEEAEWRLIYSDAAYGVSVRPDHVG
jgi:hypothetical protein